MNILTSIDILQKKHLIDFITVFKLPYFKKISKNHQKIPRDFKAHTKYASPVDMGSTYNLIISCSFLLRALKMCIIVNRFIYISMVLKGSDVGLF